MSRSKFGDYFAPGTDGQAKLIKPGGLGVNIVAVVQRVEGDRIWIKANGAGDEPVGWVHKNNAILLDNAIPYFTSRIERNPKDWDAYLRRAESEHSLNQRDAAISDYTRAIALHPNEPFLFLRRGRDFRIAKACSQAAADFEEAARLKPQWAEAYNMAAGVYADCPDPAHAIQRKQLRSSDTLSPSPPTPLTLPCLRWHTSGPEIWNEQWLRKDKPWNHQDFLLAIVRKPSGNYRPTRARSPLRSTE